MTQLADEAKDNLPTKTDELTQDTADGGSPAEVLAAMQPTLHKLVSSQLSMQLGRAPTGPDALAAKIPEAQALKALEMIVTAQSTNQLKHLEAQVKDEERKDKHAHHRFFFIGGTIGIVALVMCVFAWTAFASGKVEVATHILTAVVSLIAGGFGGYGVGRNKRAE